MGANQYHAQCARRHQLARHESAADNELAIYKSARHDKSPRLATARWQINRQESAKKFSFADSFATLNECSLQINLNFIVQIAQDLKWIR